MNSILTTIAIAMDMNAPPGITHPLLVEKYDWVDVRLRELYYGSALTADNYDEFVADGLFLEKHGWVDRRLEEMYAEERHAAEGKILMLAPFTWVYYRNPNDETINCLLEENECDEDNIKRKRSNDDIADYVDAVERAIKRIKMLEIDTNYYDEEYDMDNLSELTEDMDMDMDADEEVFYFEQEPITDFLVDNALRNIMFGLNTPSIPQEYECWNMRTNIPETYKCWTYY
jgi:hypothetical protein